MPGSRGAACPPPHCFSLSPGAQQQYLLPGRVALTHPRCGVGCNPRTPIKAFPQEAALLWAPPPAVVPTSRQRRTLCFHSMLLGLHRSRSAGGTSWTWLSAWHWGSTLPQQRGSEPARSRQEPGEGCAMPTTDKAPPLAWGITPHQENVLQRGSMGWEEAELQKCTLSTHRAHLLGNKPHHLQPRAAKHFAVSPARTYREVEGAAAGHRGPHRSAPALSLPTVTLWGN